MKKYDNIIVGAGIAGMLTGGFLSKEGQSTLIIEKKERVGGRYNCTYFDGCFGQDQGPTHWTWANGGYWHQAARMLDANIKYTYYPQTAFYTLGSGEIQKGAHEILPSAAAMADSMIGMIPGATEETKKELHDIFYKIVNMTYKEQIEINDIPAKEWLLTMTKDQKIIDFMSEFTATITMMNRDDAERIASAGALVTSLRKDRSGDGFLTIAIPDPLNGFIYPFEKAVKNAGVEIRLNTCVDKVLFDGKKAVGVQIGDEKIYAERVIVNAVFHDIPALFDGLPDEIQKPIDYMEQMRFTDYYCFYKLSGNPFKYNGVIQIMTEDGRNVGCISTQSLYMPWSVPEGKHLSIYTRVYKTEECAGLTDDQVMDECEDYQEDCFPGFKDMVESRVCIHHYPLWHAQNIAYKIPQQPEAYENLYFVGDGVTPMAHMGVDGACSTAFFLCENILGKKIGYFPER